MDELSKEQQAFIQTHIKRSAKDIWQEELIRLRGIEVGEEVTLDEMETALNQWELVETKDGGAGLRPYKCLCGKSIRYQFIVRHRRKDITYKLGSECIKNYTGINTKVAKKVLIEHKTMNHQVDEIMTKCHEGVRHVQQYLLDEEDLPPLIRKQLELDLPLTDRQLQGVFRILDKNRSKNKPRGKVVYSVLKALKEQELAYINSLSKEERKGLVVHLKDGSKVYTLEELKTITPTLIADRQDKELGYATIKLQEHHRQQSEHLNLVKQALHLLSEEQKNFWGTRMSLKQRIETAPYILEDSHKVSLHQLRGKKLDNKLKQQIRLGLPLTDKQLEKLGLS